MIMVSEKRPTTGHMLCAAAVQLALLLVSVAKPVLAPVSSFQIQTPVVVTATGCCTVASGSQFGVLDPPQKPPPSVAVLVSLAAQSRSRFAALLVNLRSTALNATAAHVERCFA